MAMRELLSRGHAIFSELLAFAHLVFVVADEDTGHKARSQGARLWYTSTHQLRHQGYLVMFSSEGDQVETYVCAFCGAKKVSRVPLVHRR